MSSQVGIPRYQILSYIVRVFYRSMNISEFSEVTTPVYVTYIFVFVKTIIRGVVF